MPRGRRPPRDSSPLGTVVTLVGAVDVGTAVVAGSTVGPATVGVGTAVVGIVGAAGVAGPSTAAVVGEADVVGAWIVVGPPGPVAFACVVSPATIVSIIEVNNDTARSWVTSPAGPASTVFKTRPERCHIAMQIARSPE